MGKKEIDKIIREFLWGRTRHKGKAYNQVKQDKVCKNRKHGGLGISQMNETNIALLIKWWWKLAESPNKAVCSVLREKYINKQRTRANMQIGNNQALQFWQDLQKMKEIFMAGSSTHWRKGT